MECDKPVRCNPSAGLQREGSRLRTVHRATARAGTKSANPPGNPARGGGWRQVLRGKRRADATDFQTWPSPGNECLLGGLGNRSDPILYSAKYYVTDVTSTLWIKRCFPQ